MHADGGREGEDRPGGKGSRLTAAPTCARIHIYTYAHTHTDTHKYTSAPIPTEPIVKFHLSKCNTRMNARGRQKRFLIRQIIGAGGRRRRRRRRRRCVRRVRSINAISSISRNERNINCALGLEPVVLRLRRARVMPLTSAGKCSGRGSSALISPGELGVVKRVEMGDMRLFPPPFFPQARWIQSILESAGRVRNCPGRRRVLVDTRRSITTWRCFHRGCTGYH